MLFLTVQLYQGALSILFKFITIAILGDLVALLLFNLIIIVPSTTLSIARWHLKLPGAPRPIEFSECIIFKELTPWLNEGIYVIIKHFTSVLFCQYNSMYRALTTTLSYYFPCFTLLFRFPIPHILFYPSFLFSFPSNERYLIVLVSWWKYSVM